MSFVPIDVHLLAVIKTGNVRGVKAALEAGASAEGPPGEPCPPIVAATIVNHAGIVSVLLEHGADPERPIPTEVSFPGTNVVASIPGERALHIAARSRKAEIVRLLLERARADPNARDSKGYTPLLAACERPRVCVEVVRLLLEAGTDLALGDDRGYAPMHLVARNDHIDLVDMLYEAAPALLNRGTTKGFTPLSLACSKGHERVVSRLLSLGAVQPTPSPKGTFCPLTMSVYQDWPGVVRVLINEGMKAVGGKMSALPEALSLAISHPRAKILRLMLAIDGEEKRSEWANASFLNRPLIHYGAGYCYPAAVSVLLEAGADDRARDPLGRIPRYVVGEDLGRNGEPEMDQGNKIAIHRMLQRGPAYRARSWAWPSDEEAEAGGSGSDGTAAADGGGDGAAGGGGTGAGAILSSPPAMKTPSVAGVRFFRWKENSSTTRNKLFVRHVGRYCAKY